METTTLSGCPLCCHVHQRCLLESLVSSLWACLKIFNILITEFPTLVDTVMKARAREPIKWPNARSIADGYKQASSWRNNPAHGLPWGRGWRTESIAPRSERQRENPADTCVNRSLGASTEMLLRRREAALPHFLRVSLAALPCWEGFWSHA